MSVEDHIEARQLLILAGQKMANLLRSRAPHGNHETVEEWDEAKDRLRHARAPVVELASYELAAAERTVIERALERAGSIRGAAELLGITRHSVKRRILKHAISWPPQSSGLGG